MRGTGDRAARARLSLCAEAERLSLNLSLKLSSERRAETRARSSKREAEPESEPENSIDNHVSPQSIPDATTVEGSPTAVKPVSREQAGEGAGVRTALVILLVALVIAAGSFAVREGAWATLQAKSRALWESVSE